MQSLNRGRGLGFSLMGVQLNLGALGTAMVAAATVALTFKRVLADQEAALAMQRGQRGLRIHAIRF